MAGKVILVRGASGAGQAAKLCNNMVLAVQQIAVGEAFVLAKLGLGASAVRCDHRRHRKLLGGAQQLPRAGTGSDIAGNNGFQPGFASALMNKDLGLAMDAIVSTGSSAPLGTHAAEIYAQYAAEHPELDFSAVIQLFH